MSTTAIPRCLRFRSTAFKALYLLNVSTFDNTKHYIYPETSFPPVTLVSTTKTPLICRNTKPMTLKISYTNIDKRDRNVIQLLSNNYFYYPFVFMCAWVRLINSSNSKKICKPWEILETHWSTFHTQSKDTIKNPIIQNHSWNGCGMCIDLLKCLSTSQRLNHQFGKKQKAILFLHLD